MQSLDVISINLWQVLISLCNLLILFWILKRFLFRPVKKVLNERQAALDEQYQKAEQAEQEADSHRRDWEQKMAGADAEADRILQTAQQRADQRSRQTLEEARENADAILKNAQAQAVLERQKAEAEIKQDIVDVSTLLTEKVLQREIRPEDHRALIDAALAEMGENDAGHQ